jgi:hypothetical protein
MPTRGVEPWENHQFPQGGYAEIHIQRLFFDNKNSIWKILGLKIQTVDALMPLLHVEIFIFEKH